MKRSKTMELGVGLFMLAGILGLVFLGLRVSGMSLAVPGETFRGRISAINTSVNPQTRTVRVRATLDNNDNLLRPGMFATINTLQPQDRQVVTIPRTAISYNTYGDYAYVVAENDDGQLVVKRRTIESGNTRDGRVAVTSGLEAGEQVVADSLSWYTSTNRRSTAVRENDTLRNQRESLYRLDARALREPGYIRYQGRIRHGGFTRTRLSRNDR